MDEGWICVFLYSYPIFVVNQALQGSVQTPVQTPETVVQTVVQTIEKTYMKPTGRSNCLEGCSKETTLRCSNGLYIFGTVPQRSVERSVPQSLQSVQRPVPFFGMLAIPSWLIGSQCSTEDVIQF